MKHAWIGMSKSGSTTLKYYLYSISKKKNVSCNSNDKKLENLVNYHRNSLDLGIPHKIKLCEYYENFIIVKNIISDDPEYYEYNADQNLKFLSEDTHIFIILRSPLDYLNSLYIQRTYGRNTNIKKKNLFLFEGSYSNRILNSINLSKLSYEKIVNLYKKRFKKVSILIFEDFFLNNYLEDIYNIKLKDSEKHLRKTSKFNHRLFVVLNKLLNFFGLSYKIKSFESNLIEEHISLKNKLNSEIQLINYNNEDNKNYFDQNYKNILDRVKKEYEIIKKLKD